MEKRISFSGVDNGLTNVMNQLRQKSKELSVNMLEDSRNIGRSGKEQVQHLEDIIRLQQIRNRQESEYNKFQAMQQMQQARESGDQKAISRQENIYNRAIDIQDTEDKEEQIMITLLREQIETMKILSREEIAENRKQVLTNIKEMEALEKKGQLDQLTGQEVFMRKLQRDMIGGSGGGGGNIPNIGKVGGGVMGGLLLGNLLQGAMQSVQGLAQAKDELDIYKPMANLAGLGAAAAGRAIGSGMDAVAGIKIAGFSLGDTDFAGIMGEAFKGAAALASEAYMRHRKLQDMYMQQAHQLTAITGKHPHVKGMSMLGMDAIEMASMTRQVTLAGGYKAAFGEEQARLFKAGQLQTGLSDQDMMKAMQIQRMTGEEDMMKVINRAKGTGDLGAFDPDDRVRMQDMFKNINSLTELLSRNATTVDQNQVAALLTTFSRVGGQFTTGDPRMMQNLQTMQGALTGTDNQFIKATQFGVARRVLESQGVTPTLLGVQKMMQQGLRNSDYVKGLFRTIQQQGGDKDYQVSSIAAMFGLRNNLEAAEELFMNRDKIMSGSVSAQDIVNATKDQGEDKGKFIQEGSKFVTELEQQQATITNAYIKSMGAGVKATAKIFTDEFSEKIKTIADEFERLILNKLTGQDQGESNYVEGVENAVDRYNNTDAPEDKSFFGWLKSDKKDAADNVRSEFNKAAGISRTGRDRVY